jgi:ATP-dependent helicase HrpB
MTNLPIYDVRDQLVTALQDHPNVIIEAPTGSGKSTQVPQILLDSGLAGDGRIVVLQPRRLAARMLARRVAVERSVKLGGEVGYQVRFDNKSTHTTRIKFETDGIILRELQGDALLRNVSVIVFDEFHERHLYSDIMLGLVRELQAGARPDLKMVVMSATLDADILVDFFDECPVIRTEGRAFPVDIRYLKSSAALAKMPVWDLVTRELPSVLREQSDGDVLIFMPGAYEIRRTVEAIRRKSIARGCLVMPLYGGLSPEEQDYAVEPAEQRKIIVSTNVAETSLTIDGVCAVIDSGLVRRASFDPRRGINTLLIEKNSQASATQRAGRAGRTAPGICLRLWSEREHSRRDLQELPELLRVDLAGTLLQLKQIGITDIDSFPWITAPPPESVNSAIGLLKNLGALDSYGAITALGERMARFPLHPRIARMLIAAEHYGCVPTICLVAALLQERSILLRNQGSKIRECQLDLCEGREDSDLLLLIKVWEEAERCRFRRDACEYIGVHGAAAKSVGVLQQQLIRMAESMGVDCFEVSPSPEAIYKSFLVGFSDHVATRGGNNRCQLVGGRRGTIEPNTVLNSEHRLFVAAEINEIGNRQGVIDVRVSGLTAICVEWLEELFSSGFGDQRKVYFDRIGRCMQAEQQICFHDLVIESKRTGDVTDDEAAEAMAAEVIAGRIVIKHWNTKVEQWINRINLVAGYCPEMGVQKITDVDRQSLIEQICYGAKSVKAVKNSEVWPVLRQWLSSSQEAVVKAYAPERIKIENGREPRLHYDDPGVVYISMRVQELYDTYKTPAICNGNLKVKFHILAPSQRIVQITDDLESFWQNGYKQIKKDLAGRYPKHEWR